MDNTYLVIGIEKFEVLYQKLKVWYTCQNLNETDYISKKKAYRESFQLEMDVKFKYDDDRLNSKLYIGSVHFVKGHHYKLVEYTDIKLDSTDLHVSFVAKPIYPLDRKEARTKFIDNRKNKLQLEIF